MDLLCVHLPLLPQSKQGISFLSLVKLPFTCEVVEKAEKLYFISSKIGFITIQATSQKRRDKNPILTKPLVPCYENVPTTAIILLQYAEHSNVLFVYCFSRSDGFSECGSVLATWLLTCN